MELGIKTFCRQMLFDCSNPIEEYNCETCPSFQTSFLSSFKRHILSNHKVDNSEEEVHRCLRCHFVTFSKFLLVRHNLNRCVKGSRNEKEKRSVYCKRDETITLRDELGVPNHELGQCLIDFGPKSSEKNFRESNRSSSDRTTSHHSKPIDIRSLQFKIKQSLKSSTSFGHSKPEHKQWLACEQCSRKYRTKGKLKKHILLCGKSLACDKCRGQFKTKITLKKHISLCHAENIEWFKCDQCPSKFKRKYGLKRHVMARHTNPADIHWFQCDQCPTRVKLKDNLRSHVRLMHLKSKESSSSNVVGMLNLNENGDYKPQMSNFRSGLFS